MTEWLVPPLDRSPDMWRRVRNPLPRTPVAGSAAARHSGAGRNPLGNHAHGDDTNGSNVVPGCVSGSRRSSEGRDDELEDGQ